MALTAVLALSGGPANPFTLLFLVQITLSAVVLSKAWTWFLGLLSISGFAFLFVAHVTVPILRGTSPDPGLLGSSIWHVDRLCCRRTPDYGPHRAGLRSLRARELEVLRLQDQFNRQEKVTSIASLAAGAAHELGTPLSTIAVAASELARYASAIAHDPQVFADAGIIRSEVERCRVILQGMSAKGAQLGGETPASICLTDLLELVRNGFPEPQRFAIRSRVEDSAAAVIPVETTRQVLAALVKNGLDASAPGNGVELKGTVAEDRIRFTVRDAGSGMTAETLKRVGEPFFTTKGPGRGMGLGTFLVRVFAENLHGSLTFDSEPNLGTTAILEWPTKGNMQIESRSVLIVDDDEVFRTRLGRAFGSRGWETLLAQSGQEAAALAAEHAPDLAVIDLRIGEENGPRMIRANSAKWTQQSILSMLNRWGSIAHRTLRLFEVEAMTMTLSKPVDADQILAII